MTSNTFLIQIYVYISVAGFWYLQVGHVKQSLNLRVSRRSFSKVLLLFLWDFNPGAFVKIYF